MAETMASSRWNRWMLAEQRALPTCCGGCRRTAFGGRALGEAFEVLSAMAADPDCLIVVTVAGAMSVAKMGRVLCDMIDASLAHIVVSTGAIMAHGLSEAVGGVHYRHDPRISDRQLYDWGYNRVYDTVEMEANLQQGHDLIARVVNGWDRSRPMCSWQLNREIGRRLFDDNQMPSILGCAYQHGVPVYVPAFTDSEMGLGVSREILAGQHASGRPTDMDSFLAPCHRTTRSSTCTTTRAACSPPSGWESSRSAAACRAIGLSRWAPSSTRSTCG